jgi:sigma-B regulation protein RsbU (phosphoserine phosphatase)
LALGDIGGKGLAAGMWVTHLVGLLRTHTAAASDPEAIVAGVNRDISRLSEVEPLSTLFVARLDWISGRLDYCSAGHPPALLLRADGALELLSDGGPVLGAVPFATFDCGSVQLGAGDLLLACSDGILESFNEADQEFGSQRLEAELRRAQGGSAESVLFSVLGAVQDFAAPRPLTDDMTLVVVKNERSSTNQLTKGELLWQ